jgi:cation:H+ antiporter
VFNDAAVFLVSLLILIVTGAWVVKSLTKLSQALGLRYFVVGFILLAVATTLPELSVGISSALHHEPILSLGNILGSNIVNLSLIFGLIIILRQKLFPSKPIIRRDSFIAVGAGLLVLLLILDKNLSQVDGLLLLVGFIFYLRYLISQEIEFPARITGSLLVGCAGALYQFIISVVLLILSANSVVDSGIIIASNWGVPEFVIGALVLGFGTSLPELTFAIQSVRLQKEELTLGDLMGATVINSTLVLGLTAIINPITNINPASIVFTGLVSLAVFIGFLMLINSKKARWPVAFVSLSIYFAYVILEIFIRK